MKMYNYLVYFQLYAEESSLQADVSISLKQPMLLSDVEMIKNHIRKDRGFVYKVPIAIKNIMIFPETEEVDT